MRWVLCVATWMVTGLAALGIAAETSIGPVVVTFAPGHGLHLGDLIALTLAVSVSLTATGLALARRPRPGSHRTTATDGERVRVS